MRIVGTPHNVGKDPQARAHHDAGQRRQSVQPVREVDGVGQAGHEDEDEEGLLSLLLFNPNTDGIIEYKEFEVVKVVIKED